MSTSTRSPSRSTSAARRSRAAGSVTSQATTSARTPCFDDSSPASERSFSSLRATRVTPWPRPASSRANASPIPEDAPVISAVNPSSGVGSAMARHARDMPDYTKLNLRQDVEDMAPQFGYGSNMEAHFARKALGLANSGVSYFKVAPGFRVPFGHTHDQQEEVYVVLSGGGRVRAGDDIVELAELDAI